MCESVPALWAPDQGVAGMLPLLHVRRQVPRILLCFWAARAVKVTSAKGHNQIVNPLWSNAHILENVVNVRKRQQGGTGGLGLRFHDIDSSIMIRN